MACEAIEVVLPGPTRPCSGGRPLQRLHRDGESTLAVGSTGTVYAAWEDSRTGNYDIFSDELYYMVVPFDAADGRGASTYSLGVWTRTFQGHETLGLPLRPPTVRSVDWFCNAIPNALGMDFLRDGAWVGHFTQMPAGVYDADVVQGVGYQITVSPGSGRYSFIGW